ncbi:dipeptide ABC transporter ATP-binding protein [Halostreptopolyspora alba]|uniref:ABC transporter ATP-binding protein n=1 Tax=Halostreptopolyspora alba TaxID=2487137 RepID=A0A3N0E6P7_9ACTN|nr:ABC transporter ATP-binding protein [Nocardiopsaceae bacterium YIM 96095]
MTDTETRASAGDRRVASSPALEVRDLHVTFPPRTAGANVRAVRGLDYQLEHGEVLGVVGESGSGKSVSSLAVMGLLPGDARVSGSVRLNGAELLGLDDEAMSARRGSSISMVFQDPLSALTPVYTVGDQVAEAIRTHNPTVGGRAAARRAVELLDLVGIPEPGLRYRAFPHEFSGGMRQRVTIAIAVANDPDVIICDEPTTALDVTIQTQVLDVLRRAQRETGAAVVMITHDLGVLAGLVDRVLVMYAGRPVETGTVDEVYHHPRMPYTMGLLSSVPRLDETERTRLIPIRGDPPSLTDLPEGCPFSPRCPMVIDTCHQTEPGLRPAGGAGHTAACVRAAEIRDHGWTGADVYPESESPATPHTPADRRNRDTVLRVAGLVKHHPLTKGTVFRRRVGTVRAVDGISFDITEGETLGLVGESGCGKSTTLLEILRLRAPQSGTVVVLGRDSARVNRRERFAIRRDVQVVFQDPMSSLDPRMRVFDIVAEPLRTHRYPRSETRSRVSELLRLVGLDPAHAGRFPQEFSGGQRQRIGIARALALRPRLLVLDEPVSALDVSIQAGVLNLLDRLKTELGLSYLFVAHDLAVVRHIADRVAVMYLGRIVEIGATESLFSAPSHPYTQALLSAVPVPDPQRERSRKPIVLEGDLPNPANPPTGCRFRPRCPKFGTLTSDEQQACSHTDPELTQVTTGDHSAACHYTEKRSVI